MKVKRKIIVIDEDLCDGCGLCAKACSEGAIRIIEGKAKLVAEKYCDGLGACIGECPNNALRILEREAEEFDAEAVENYLETLHCDKEAEKPALACGCPSSYVMEFDPSEHVHANLKLKKEKDNDNLQSDTYKDASHTLGQSSGESALTHWPVQIRLIPASARFLEGAHLLIAADCSTVVLPNLHRDFLKGRVVMIGCPKFDDPAPSIQKFADIFKARTIKDITVLVMEVPCCQGLPIIIKKGMELAGVNIPIEKIILNPKGNIIKRETDGKG